MSRRWKMFSAHLCRVRGMGRGDAAKAAREASWSSPQRALPGTRCLCHRQYQPEPGQAVLLSGLRGQMDTAESTLPVSLLAPCQVASPLPGLPGHPSLPAQDMVRWIWEPQGWDVGDGATHGAGGVAQGRWASGSF